ncbi:MAG: MBL fold metallo-hydrolase [bacterium]
MSWLKVNIKKIVVIVFITSVVLSIGVFFYLYQISSGQAKKLRISFLDVGQGDAELIQTAEGQNILIDGGPNKSVLSALNSRLPWWDKTFEVVVLTHEHDDHLAGLIEVLKRYKVGKIYLASSIKETPLLKVFTDLATEKNVPINHLALDYKIKFGENYLNLLVATGTLRGGGEFENENSLIEQLVTPSDDNILLMGDAGKAREEVMINGNAKLHAQIIKIGHHGSDGGTTENFLKFVAAPIVVVSVGQGNKYGHPSPRILQRFKRLNESVFRTDLLGTITFSYQNKAWSLD